MTVTTCPPKLTAEFDLLFDGNPFAVGGNEGKAIRIDLTELETLHEISEWKLWKVHDHLWWGEPIGIYPIVNTTDEINKADIQTHKPLGHVKWGCVDWDEGYETSWTDAINTYNILAAFDITSWIEKSRSKGWHLWVFTQEWIPAATMRLALLAACQIVGAPIKEVNPKQLYLLPNGLGNYVRLPYPNALREAKNGTLGNLGISQHIVNPDNPDEWEDPFTWAPRAIETRNSTQNLQRLAARAKKLTARADHAPQHPAIVDAPLSEVGLDSAVTRKLDGLSFTLLMDGPLPDPITGKIDRSAGLWKLASLLKERGCVDAGEAWSVMCAADRRWGKFLERNEPDLLRVTLEKAWR